MKGKKGDPNPDRVTHHELDNLMGDIHSAPQEMALTGAFRHALLKKKVAKPDRKKAEPNVYHFILSWAKEENPPEGAGMVQCAREILELLGLSEHEAVFVAHGDTNNPHLHVVVNRINPNTGLRWDKWNNHYTMNQYAARWMKRNGLELWQQGAGKGQRLSRKAYERQNAAKRAAEIAALPAAILEALTLRQSTFTDAHLARAVSEATNTPEEFAQVLCLVRALPEFIELEKDEATAWTTHKGGLDALAPSDKAQAAKAWEAWKDAEKWHSFNLPEYVSYVQERAKAITVRRYTSKSLRFAEERLAKNAGLLAGTMRHRVAAPIHERARAAIEAMGRETNPPTDQTETLAALDHLLDPRGLSMIVGYAGAGKSTLMKFAAEAWTTAGYNVRGLAIAGRAAEGLQIDAKINSGTIAGLLEGLKKGTETISAKDVFVIDEAGMVGSVALDTILRAIREAGAKIVMVGDPEQLQAIDAGGPFAYLLNHYENAVLKTIHRQRAEWMKKATVALAEQGTAAALDAYAANGMVHEHEDKQSAIETILDQWQAGRDTGGTQIIMAATNAEANAINEAARDRLFAAGVLGWGHDYKTEFGNRTFAKGDRILFRRNSRFLGVKNGTTGTVIATEHGRLAVRIDGEEARAIVVDPKQYAYFDWGYCATLHKNQGVTCDRAYVLASKNMNRQAAYVSLSRHRHAVSFHWSREDFRDWTALARKLSRNGAKETSLSYRADIRASVEELTKDIRPNDDTAQVEAWGKLYDQQRHETAEYEGMSMLRRAFWMAANISRFFKAGAFTLEKVQERERCNLYTALKKLGFKFKSAKGQKPRPEAPVKPKPEQMPTMKHTNKSATQILFNTMRH